MISTTERQQRRARLTAAVDGPILLMGMHDRARNLPMNSVPFRQDSTFLYYVGYDQPGATALLDADGCTLFLPEPDADDPLWHGPTPSFDDIREQLGVDQVRPSHQLDQHLRGKAARTLAIADTERNRWASALLDTPLRFGQKHGDDALVRAVIEARRVKSAAELAEMRLAAAASAAAHQAVMKATHPGAHERGLNALFTAVLELHDCTPGYGTILTQRGEVLHNHHHDQALSAGSMLLVDGGGERNRSGYGVDITRTWPVGGSFSARQRAAYEAVLASQAAAIAKCTIGRRYREVHDTASVVLAQFLVDEGLVRGSAEDAVASGAHALFFPHGVGHHLGLDVHDLENFGDLPSYPAGQGRPEQFGTRFLRLDLPLEQDWVVTIEPGLYVVPAILGDATLRDRFKDQVDFERAEQWLGFGGIRIEDDIRIDAGGPENLTAATPKTVDEIEGIVGSGPRPEELLC